MVQFATLDSLFAAIKVGEVDLSSNLPTFGGDEPIHAPEIWSWDPFRFMVGSSIADLTLMPRDEWEGDVGYDNPSLPLH